METERFQKREEEEEQANVFKTQKARAGRNGGAEGKGKGKGDEKPLVSPAVREAGTYGGRFSKMRGKDSKLFLPPQAIPSPR